MSPRTAVFLGLFIAIIGVFYLEIERHNHRRIEYFCLNAKDEILAQIDRATDLYLKANLAQIEINQLESSVKQKEAGNPSKAFTDLIPTIIKQIDKNNERLSEMRDNASIIENKNDLRLTQLNDKCNIDKLTSIKNDILLSFSYIILSIVFFIAGILFSAPISNLFNVSVRSEN